MSEKRKRERSESVEEEELEAPPLKTIPASKLQAYSVGRQKKSAFEKRKEEIDLKKQACLQAFIFFIVIIQQESLEAAKVYAEFVASFQEPVSYKLGTTSFVKAGTLNPATNTINDASSSSPPPKPMFKAMPFVKASESTSKLYSLDQYQSKEADDEEDDDEDELAKLKKSKSQKRNLDTFLEEIKKEQQVRNSAKSSETITTTDDPIFGDGDPLSTNLFVSNIHPSVTELGLCQEFGKYGPIASVKIMWPRTQDEKDKGRNNGFVCFMKRSDAAEAIKNLNGIELEGFKLRVGWGKAVALPAEPVFVLEKATTTTKTGLPFNAQIDPGQPGVNSRPRAVVRVTKPTNINTLRLIHRTIERVLEIIMQKEQNNPQFKFLFDNISPEHIYYRWKLYSMLQGDTKSRWNDEPFQMFEGGAWWIPPELPFVDEIVNILCKSILVPDVPLSVKLARLYLISDILHNSSVHVSNAWKYRIEFESQLPLLFEHFNSIYRSINARLKAEQMRKYIFAVISVWENWMIFPKYYTDQLTRIFLRKDDGTLETVNTQEVMMNEDIDGEPIEDIDGEPIEEDIDGEPIEDIDGEPIEDIDGEPIETKEQEKDKKRLLSEIDDMFCIK
ncbi:hypothetical protein RMCBS344292_18872 [Rhizopus microsporus]|nr:hypothetical protein RMCBS344292_18872 [Rhizopus microsporus]